MLKYRLILGTILIAMITVITLFALSGSSNPLHAAEAADNGSSLWCTMSLHGCKPATQILLLEENGKIEEGYFVLTETGKEGDGKQSGFVTSMKLKHISKDELRMTVTVLPGDKPMVQEWVLSFSKPENASKRVAKFWTYNEKGEKQKELDVIFTKLHQPK